MRDLLLLELNAGAMPSRYQATTRDFTTSRVERALSSLSNRPDEIHETAVRSSEFIADQRGGGAAERPTGPPGDTSAFSAAADPVVV